MKAQYRSITAFKLRRYLQCSASLLPVYPVITHSSQPLHPPPHSDGFMLDMNHRSAS